jgi:hypothetical protein
MPFHGLDRPGGCGLPSTDRLSGFVSAGNGKIQGGPRSTRRVMTRERNAARGFLVLPKRFVVERAVAWLNRCRRQGLGMTQPTSARFLTPPLRLAHGAQDMPQHDVIPNRLSQHLDEAAERQIETQHQAQLKGLPTDSGLVPMLATGDGDHAVIPPAGLQVTRRHHRKSTLMARPTVS